MNSHNINTTSRWVNQKSRMQRWILGAFMGLMALGAISIDLPSASAAPPSVSRYRGPYSSRYRRARRRRFRIVNGRRVPVYSGPGIAADSSTSGSTQAAGTTP